MKNFVCDSIMGGKCAALNEHYKSESSDELFNINSQEIGVGCNVCDTLDKDFDYVNKYGKHFEDEHDWQFEHYRDFNQYGKWKYANNKLLN